MSARVGRESSSAFALQALLASLPFIALLGCANAAPSSVARPVEQPATVSAAAGSIAEPKYEKASAAKIGGLDRHVWPPPRIEAVEDGEWTAFDRPWMHTIEGAPPTFYTTFVRPDPNRKARVQVVALDARQIELDLAIGAEGPYPPDESKLGKWPRGGKLPREKKIATRVVAAFNGGFRFDQGKWGMTIDRRQFMPPAPDVASLLMFDDGRLGFGDFGPTMKVPSDVRSLRQNLDPLVDDGVINPRKRLRWGGIKATGVQVAQRAKRSGICRTAAGDLLYLWGNQIEAAELGLAMTKAGCDFGMHLDMNILHVGFVFMSFDDEKYSQGNSEALSSAMGVTKKRYTTQPNPKEFFYATLRDETSLGPSGASDFRADGAVQPPPAWLPAVLTKTEGDVRITYFDGRRVRFAMTGGYAELDAAGKPLYASNLPSPFKGDDAEQVLAAIPLGIATKEAPLRLVLDSELRVPMATSPLGARALLSILDRDGVLDDNGNEVAGRLMLTLPGAKDTSENSSAKSGAKWSAQAMLVIVEGKAIDVPLDVLQKSQTVIGLDARGDLLVVEAMGSKATPSLLIEALLRAGCLYAVVPRGGGGGIEAKLQRIGRDEIFTGGRETRLYVLAATPPSATFRFDRDAQGKPRWPKVTTPVK